jgi:hypothetical protein
LTQPTARSRSCGRYDLDAVLTSHGYDKAGSKYRHPNSGSGSFGADIKVLGDGIERLYSHNATDPLHAGNLPAWCDVKAIDAFDVVCILEFGSDRTRALRELAERFNLTKEAEWRAVARMIYRHIDRGSSQTEIEAAAFAEGRRRGVTRDEVCRISQRVAARPSRATAATA